MHEDKPLISKVSDDVLAHYGIKYRSGRYPYGSGEDPYQHSGDLLSRYEAMQKEGMDDVEIAKQLGTTSTKLRVQLQYARHQRRQNLVDRAIALKEDGKTPSEIARIMGYSNESSVRSLLNTKTNARKKVAQTTAETLKDFVDKNGMVDIGKGVEASLGISRAQLDEAIYILEMEGYNVFGGSVPQLTNPGKMIHRKVLTTPDKVHKDIYNYDQVHRIDEELISYDQGDSYKPAFHYPESLDSKRLQVVYGDEGGTAKDGVIEIRRGVEDLSLGDSHYAQVRIMVDGTHYIKGMAVYADDLPEGVDIRFNTNKPTGTPILGDKQKSVLKPIKNDPDNPFGSNIKEHGGQYWYGENNDKLGLINKAREEGDWMEWSDTLPSQFLSKQPKELYDRQLSLSIEDAESEFNDINSLTNPTVKKFMLNKYADECDSAAVHLKAAALPRQKYQVILPLDISETEVYAPNYQDGEQVALIRYPHGGRFEIPILTVNNKLEQGKSILGTSPMDAIGISPKVAEQLSGADFDGDTVMVIPTGKGGVNIASKPKLKELENFDPKMEYGGKEPGTFKQMTKQQTQTEMGKISNLITDMTIKGASDDEIARAVKHSMVVIDAEKHRLDYKQSEQDNGIAELKAKYQKKDDGGSGGASTLISRSTSETHPLKTKGMANINPVTGEKTFDEITYVDPKSGETVTKKSKYVEEKYLDISVRNPETGKMEKAVKEKKKQYYDDVKKSMDILKKDGNPIAEDGKFIDITSKDTFDAINRKAQETDNQEVMDILGKYKIKENLRTTNSTRMADVKDARELISDYDTAVERAYAEYANKMKSLANEARKTAIATNDISYNPKAAEAYAAEVAKLNSDLLLAKKNAPKERQAQGLADMEVKAKVMENPKMTDGDIKKAKQQSLAKYRASLGAKRVSIDISDKQWEAIQAGAITATKLKDILNHTDTDVLRQKALPKTTTALSTVKKQKIDSMAAFGYTQAQIAERLGVSPATVNKYIQERRTNK